MDVEPRQMPKLIELGLWKLPLSCQQHTKYIRYSIFFIRKLPITKTVNKTQPPAYESFPLTQTDSALHTKQQNVFSRHHTRAGNNLPPPTETLDRHRHLRYYHAPLEQALVRGTRLSSLRLCSQVR